MPSEVLWKNWSSRGTVLGTELNGLVTTARSNAGAVYAGDTIKQRFGKLEMQVTFASAPDAGGYVEIYAVTSLDGTNYEDGSNSVNPGTHKLIDRIPVRDATGAQRLQGRMFPLEPGKTRFMLANHTGQDFPASGSSVVLYTTSEEGQ